jgi:YD repeat-containing protein
MLVSPTGRRAVLARLGSFLLVVVLLGGILPAGSLAASPSPSQPAPTGDSTAAPSEPQPTPTADTTPQPSASASPVAPSPTPIETPTPTADPTPDPTASPSLSVDPDTGLKVGATEVVAERNATSQTFDNHDGTRTTQFYTAPIFYQPTGTGSFEPIEVGFTADAKIDDTVTARSDQAPVAVAVAPADTADGFLTQTADGQTISLALPNGQLATAPNAAPTLDGPAANYHDIMPGLDLRILAEADGAKSFFIWHAPPTDPTIDLAVAAPGLTARLEQDGTISFLDVAGIPVAHMPRPYAIDSTPDATLGSGIYVEKVSYALDPTGTTLTVSVDPAWLKTAVYPVYVDPTVVWDNQGDLTVGDAHIASGYNTTNFSNYQRPDSPYYHELWLGSDPAGVSGTSYDYLKWNLPGITGTVIDSATLDIYPYHQYYNAPTSTTTWLRQVVSINGQAAWQETYPTWVNQYSTVGGILATSACVELTTCSFGVTSIVQAWANGSAPNHGIRLDENSNPSTYWKRLIAAEQGGSHLEHLTVTYHTISATPATPALSGATAWIYGNGDSRAQTKFHVDISTASTFPTILLTSGDVTSGLPNWKIGAGLTDDVQYWYRVKVYDGVGWSNFSAATAFTYDAYQRGDESYYAQTPFDLGGGWNLEIGAQNGAASLSRSFFTIPSYGPPQSLELSYSSAGPTTAGMFGAGWSSNLTQYTSFETGLVVWHRSDGGRVAFPAAGGAAYGSHFETMALVGSTDVITLPDQTKLTFQNAGSGHLLSIANRFTKALTLSGWGTSTITATDASTRSTTLAADPADSTRIKTVTDSAGRIWTFAYAGTGATSDLSSITESDPDAGGPLVAPATAFTYVAHQVTAITRTRTKAAGGTESIVWAIGYTSGKATTVVDPISSPTASTFTYSAGSTVAAILKSNSGPVRNSTTYNFDAFGRPASTLDPQGFTSSWTYDAASNELTATRPISSTISATTTYTYDARGNMLTEVAPIDASTTVTTASSYSTTNDQLTTSEADNDSAIKLVTKYTYDGSGHLTSVDVNCTTSGTTPPATASTCTGAGTQDTATNLVTNYAYTSHDQLEFEQDPLGRVTKHVYDASGNETSTIRDCTTSGTTMPRSLRAPVAERLMPRRT